MEATNKLTLYDLTSEYLEIEDALIESGGEVTDKILSLMDANKEAMTAKVDGYNKILRRMEGTEDALDAEIRRLTALKKTAANAGKSIKEHLMYAMQAAGLDRIDGTLCKAYLRKTTALDVDEEAMFRAVTHGGEIVKFMESLPEYFDIDIRVNKTKVKKLFPAECGTLPAGCRYIENTSITIK
jgi:hypothetical protein